MGQYTSSDDSSSRDVVLRLDRIERQLSILAPANFVTGAREDVGETVSLIDIWFVFWSRKWFVILPAVICVCFSVFYSRSLPDIYRSEALLAPAEEAQGESGFMASQLGGVAALAGVNVVGGGDKVSTTIEIMKSRAFAKAFLDKYDVWEPLLAARSWDPNTGQLILDESIYSQEHGGWQGIDIESDLIKLKAAEKLSSLIDIKFDSKVGVLRMAIEHVSPIVAKRWVDLLVGEINLIMKARDISEAKKSIDYLNSQLSKTSVAGLRQVFYRLIEEQTKKIMLAEIREEYVFTTLDEAVVPYQKVSPSRSMIVVVSGVLGGFLGVVFVLIMHIVFLVKRTASDEGRASE